LTLRAAGGFGEKPKDDTSPGSKVSADEKAADPQQALDTDVEEMRKAMGTDNTKSAIDGFEVSAMEPSAPDKQISRNPGGKRAEPSTWTLVRFSIRIGLKIRLTRFLRMSGDSVVRRLSPVVLRFAPSARALDALPVDSAHCRGWTGGLSRPIALVPLARKRVGPTSGVGRG